MIILHDNKSHLEQIRQVVHEQLAKDRLLLHPNKANVMPVRNGVDLLGYRVFPFRKYLRNDNGHRFHRKLRGLAKNYLIIHVSQLLRRAVCNVTTP